ncbi:MAG: VWA domain-containing protein [Oscillospiraceae bacterium]|nr:VWA domain-containing protein [Oscillospiraceae bacterium]
MKTAKRKNTKWGIYAAVTALLLSLASALPASAERVAPNPAGQAANQVVYAGGERFYDAAGEEVGSLENNAVVAITKTAAQIANTENEFDVTLTVKTKEDIVSLAPDAAVVLVFDTSWSMVDTVNADNVGENTRLARAKTAAIAFLDTYAGSAGSERWFSLVTFNTNVSAIELNGSGQYWVDVAASAGYDLAKAAINAITITDVSNHAGTNINGALRVAENLLEATIAGTYAPSGKSGNWLPVNRNAVLFTDGTPTKYFAADSGASGIAITGHPVGVANNIDGTGGAAAANTAASSERAAAIKDDYHANFYSIAFADASADWLTAIGATVVESSASGDLTAAFETIANAIYAQAWILTDPMGDYIVWEELVNTPEPGVGQAFDDDSRTFTWDLKQVDAQEPVNSWYTYTYTYRVTLDNLSGNRYTTADNPTATNGTTTLSYYVVDGGAASGLRTVEFTVPTVKGYFDDISFTKQVQDKDAPERPAAYYEFTFELWTTGAGAEKVATALTDGTGNVRFNNVPSGHAYTIKEAANPDYKQIEDKDVSVAWGLASGAVNGGAILNVAKDYVPPTPPIVPSVTTPTPTPPPPESPPPTESEPPEITASPEPSPSDPPPTAPPIPPAAPPPPPSAPGGTLVPEEDGTYLELDEDGTPLGYWTQDPDTGEWIFDPIVPLGELPATGDNGAALWIAIAASAALGAAAVGTRKKVK